MLKYQRLSDYFVDEINIRRNSVNTGSMRLGLLFKTWVTLRIIKLAFQYFSLFASSIQNSKTPALNLNFDSTKKNIKWYYCFIFADLNLIKCQLNWLFVCIYKFDIYAIEITINSTLIIYSETMFWRIRLTTYHKLIRSRWRCCCFLVTSVSNSNSTHFDVKTKQWAAFAVHKYVTS